MSLTKSNLPHRLHLLADDLTGACDAAAPFAARGASTQVFLFPPFTSSTAHVQSLCTATRDVSPEQAADAIQTLAHALRANRNVEPFKKIDSVFRGNTLVEIAATTAAFPDYLAVIAPAFPSQGRIYHQDQLHVTDATGSRSLPLRATFAATSLTPHWLPPQECPTLLAAAFNNAPTNTIFCEATTAHHLLTIVTAAESQPRPVLWIGSAGLAQALAEFRYPDSQPTPSITPLPGRLLIITGSDHPVTQRQLAALSPGTATLRIERNQTPHEEIRAFVSTHGDIACLALNGGDTALHVCRALSITSFCLQGEYAPGIPIATAHGGPWQGTRLRLKSGGFGESNLLARISQDLAS